MILTTISFNDLMKYYKQYWRNNHHESSERLAPPTFTGKAEAFLLSVKYAISLIKDTRPSSCEMYMPNTIDEHWELPLRRVLRNEYIMHERQYPPCLYFGNVRAGQAARRDKCRHSEHAWSLHAGQWLDWWCDIKCDGRDWRCSYQKADCNMKRDFDSCIKWQVIRSAMTSFIARWED